MARTYTNYRWEPLNVRKGDRYCYKRDVVWPDMPWRTDESQVIATVTYDADSKSPYWGKWHVNIGAQSPELNALRLSDIPKFTSKDDAIAWVTAMVRLSL
jgi:hypothetical protein